MQTYASGKALLVIECTGKDHKGDPYIEIYPFIQRCTMHGKGDPDIAEDSARELINCMSYYQSWLPLNLNKMEIGAVWRVYIQFEAAGSKDYWGEYDEELTINKCKVLRKQKPKEYYQCKSRTQTTT